MITNILAIMYAWTKKCYSIFRMIIYSYKLFLFSCAAHSRSKFGQRLQAMEYGGMFCRGNETSLLHCEIFSNFVETASSLIISNQGDYAGVRCIPRTSKNKY